MDKMRWIAEFASNEKLEKNSQKLRSERSVHRRKRSFYKEEE